MGSVYNALDKDTSKIGSTDWRLGPLRVARVWVCVCVCVPEYHFRVIIPRRLNSPHSACTCTTVGARRARVLREKNKPQLRMSSLQLCARAATSVYTVYVPVF